LGKGDKRHKQKLPSLAPIEGKSAHPRDRRGTQKPADDAPRVALTARCRLFGITPTEDARRALSGQHSGSDIGMVMQREISDQQAVAALWAVWQAWCMAERTYRLRIIGVSGSPKGASIASIPDKLESDQRHTIDSRSEDDKNRDATNNWMRWQGFLGHLSAGESSLLHSARRGDGKPLWSDRMPTRCGVETLQALRALAKIVGK